MSAAPAPITHAPPILWAAARALIVTLFNFFGEPSEIAALYMHRHNERRLLLKWLRAGEALMRHLLLIEAAACAQPNARRMRARKFVLRKPRLITFEADKPEAWRVSFRTMQRWRPRQPNRALQEKRKRPSLDERWRAEYLDPPKFYPAWPLAERAEALLRAFNNPEPYARRLARRLHATPHRTRELTRWPENLPDVIDCADALRENAEIARRRFESG